MAKQKTTTLLGEVQAMDDSKAVPRDWFAKLDPAIKAELSELCQDFLDGGTVRRKFATATDMYHWLYKKGIVSVRADRFRHWLRELGANRG